jgi:pimeloyl-ACP methyl ester carboxylesterase
VPAIAAPPPAPPGERPAIVRTVACPRSLPGATCGFVGVPLDRRLPDGRRIRIYFEHYPRRDRARRAISTVLSLEGGPGYSTTAARDGRFAVWRPVSARRDLLLVDLRGTGRSGALSCPAFEDAILPYVGRAGRCARQLGPRRDFYTTSQSVQDLEDVLRALRLGRVDVYGDSYGSYAAQAFALRHPERVRSLVLDSTYTLPGSDPAWTDLLAATRDGISLACRRRPDCPTGAEDPVRALAGLVERVRRDPIAGRAPNGDGEIVPVRVDEDALVQTAQGAFAYPAVWRDIVAAARSSARGDHRPLLRLVAESLTVDGPSGDPRFWSEALYLAVICNDYPQPWPDGTPIADRPAAYRASLAAYPPGTFWPFTPEAWTGTDYEGVLACLRWPEQRFDDPVVPPGTPYPGVPTLVLNGDLDNITPVSGAREVARRFPNSTYVTVENSFHVTALGDQFACASVLYTRFVRTLAAGDTSCARRTAEIRTVARFPLRLSEVVPARPRAGTGDASLRRDRRLAAVAAHTAADVVIRWWANFSGSSVGLRGGRWSYTGDDVVAFRLRGTQLVPGVRVSGTVRWTYATQDVRGRLVARAPGLSRAALSVRWRGRSLAVARIDGRSGGRALHLSMLAP